ncbi:MAG: bifunctional sugar-1-phosphate nucleotidylyltransferase/acetyltransferase [Halobacteriaceae archaeon]
MQTVVLAAGKGTRMRPLTDAYPKPMLPVAGKPLLEHTLQTATRAGASKFIIVVGYNKEIIQSYFGESFQDIPITYVVQDTRQGTADALKTAQSALSSSDPVIVLNGDSLFDQPSIDALYDADIAVGSIGVDDPTQYGVLETGSDDQYLVDIVEKPDDPPTNQVNTGAYLFPPTIQKYLDVEASKRGEYELTDVLSQIVNDYTVETIEFNRWLDVGRPWELLEANEWKLNEISRYLGGEISPQATVQGTVYIEVGASIREGAVIEGPAYIATNSAIGPNAYIRGSTYIGPDVHIGHAVEVKNSVIMKETNISHLSYVGDSVLGREVNLGAGTQVANLRHDGESVHMVVKGESTSTGRRKFGVVLGDGVKTGINTSLNAGVRLDTNATTAPGETVMYSPDSN